MPRNGAGTASLASAPFVFDTVISETPMNANFSDIINMITASIANDGQTPILANLPMSGYKHTGVTATSGTSSRTEYVSTGTMQDGVPLDAGETAGTSTVYTATLSPAITAYADKQCFRVKFDEACGSSPTINFNSVGAKKIYKNVSGSAVQLAANDVLANTIGILRYDTALDAAAGGFWLINGAAAASQSSYSNTTSGLVATTVQGAIDALVSPGYLYGITLSNNGSDANNDIDFAAGRCVDNSTSAMMVLSAITKRLDASWAVGTNQGGLDTGAKANSTCYHCWVIGRSDTNVVDALFSTSATAPTMPANYDRKRRVGAIWTDGSGNIRAFTQYGNRFDWAVPINDVNLTTVSTSGTLAAITVPTSLNIRAILNIILGVGASGERVNVTSPATTDAATSTSNAVIGCALANSYAVNQIECATNTSRQVRYRAEFGSGSVGFLIQTVGWFDMRGQDV